MYNKNRTFATLLFTAASIMGMNAQTHQWTLSECINYAMEHSIKLQQNKVSEQSTKADELKAKAGLFPSLSFSTSQNVTYRPYQNDGGNFVNDGIATQHNSNVTENGTYGLNASWTVWDGGINTKSIKSAKLSSQMAELATAEAANNIQEQIAQLYVQILYSTEAKRVNESILATSQKQYDRGVELVKAGQMAKSELTQLASQVTSGQYNVVNMQTTIDGYLLQLKQLLELDGNEKLSITNLEVNDEAVICIIPNKDDIYQKALATRPEIKSGQMSIEAADVNIGIAKAGYSPTLRLQAGVGDSHTSGTNNNLGTQMKQNLNGSVGVNLSVPIFDNRSNKTAVEKAKLEKINKQLALQDQQKQLYSTVETHWLNATNSQRKFLAAQSNVESMRTSYEQCNEQFRLGLKNIVELMTSRDNLINAEQEKLQSKYTTLLNMQLLKFYGGEQLSL